MSQEIDYLTRDFLNLEGFHAGAYLLATVKAGRRDDPTSSEAWVEASLTLTDCNRQIQLDFSAWNAEQRDNALFKARILKDRIDAFVETFQLAHLTFDVTRSAPGLILPGSSSRDATCC